MRTATCILLAAETITPREIGRWWALNIWREGWAHLPPFHQCLPEQSPAVLRRMIDGRWNPIPVLDQCPLSTHCGHSPRPPIRLHGKNSPHHRSHGSSTAPVPAGAGADGGICFSLADDWLRIHVGRVGNRNGGFAVVGLGAPYADLGRRGIHNRRRPYHSIPWAACSLLDRRLHLTSAFHPLRTFATGGTTEA